jgi:hypothetical protein
MERSPIRRLVALAIGTLLFSLVIAGGGPLE